MKSYGKIARLWRYPVKSFLGESCNRLFIDSQGVSGDRWFAISNKQGKFGSGKNTRRFCKIDGLFDFKAKYDRDLLQITFPDGRIFKEQDPNLDKELSSYLGQAVTLTSEKKVSHFDADALHIITTASLQWLKNILPKSTIDERRFRPNLLIDLPGQELIEHNWLGQKILLGEEVEIKITDLTERCIMTDFAQRELDYDRRINKTINKQAKHNFGVYAKVVKQGTVCQGDLVRGL